jgi:hypothetical protein
MVGALCGLRLNRLVDYAAVTAPTRSLAAPGQGEEICYRITSPEQTLLLGRIIAVINFLLIFDIKMPNIEPIWYIFYNVNCIHNKFSNNIIQRHLVLTKQSLYCENTVGINPRIRNKYGSLTRNKFLMKSVTTLK